MKIYDISVEINPELPVWPGDPKVKITRSQITGSRATMPMSRRWNLDCIPAHIWMHPIIS